MRKSTRALILAVGVAACQDKATPLDLGGPPSAVTGVSGNDQRGAVNQILPVPLVVEVTDDEGNPSAGVEVRWAAKSGAISATIDTTDGAGRSGVFWQLPDTPGVDSVIAVVPGIGNVLFGATVQPTEGVITFRFIDAGGYHACGITTAEVLLCWGYGADGQLGNGSTSPQLFPVLIPGDFRYRRVAGGYYHACGWTLAANAYCWGNNTDGRVTGGSGGSFAEPQLVNIATTIDTLQGDTVVAGPTALLVQAMAAGEAHTCAIDLARKLFCWGRNSEGQLGRGDIGGFFPPTQVGGEFFEEVSVGGLHTCAITIAGGGRCWGYNIAGQLGDGSTTTSATPVSVAGQFRTDPVVIFPSPDPDFPLPPGPFVAAGYDHSCAITTAGATLCWGLNQNGQLGIGSLTASTSPATVSGGHAFAAVTAGLRHTCALDTSGAAWCWGDNTYGELGNGNNTRSAVPVAVSGTLTFAYIKAGELFTCGVTSEGEAYCWGDNEFGQLGNGSTTSSNVPVKVAFQP